jgi:hypothetical protein
MRSNCLPRSCSLVANRARSVPKSAIRCHVRGHGRVATAPPVSAAPVCPRTIPKAPGWTAEDEASLQDLSLVTRVADLHDASAVLALEAPMRILANGDVADGVWEIRGTLPTEVVAGCGGPVRALRDLARSDPFRTGRFAWIDARDGAAALLGLAFDRGRTVAHAMPRPPGMSIDGCPHHVLCRLSGVDFVEQVVSTAALLGDKVAIEALAAACAEADAQLDSETSDAVRMTIASYRHPERFSLRTIGVEAPPAQKRSVGGRIRRKLRRWRVQSRRNPLPRGRRIVLEGDAFEVHTLVCAKDVAMSLWSLRSFFAHSKRTPRVIVHDDGTLTEKHRALYAEHFGGVEVLDDRESSACMDELLRPWPTCRRFRRDPHFYCARKLFDFVFVARCDAVVMIDSDVLFFRKPTELLDHATRSSACFASDYQNAYSSTLPELESWRGEPILPCVNAGLLSVSAAAYRTRMDLVERYLAHAERAYPGVDVNRHEQTVHALLMSALNATRLPDTYAISGAVDADTVSFHFVNDGVSRARFFRARSQARIRTRP